MSVFHGNKVINIETGEHFPSVKEAGKKYNVTPATINAACKGRQKTAAGFHWALVPKTYMEKGLGRYGIRLGNGAHLMRNGKVRKQTSFTMSSELYYQIEDLLEERNLNFIELIRGFLEFIVEKNIESCKEEKREYIEWWHEANGSEKPWEKYDRESEK